MSDYSCLDIKETDLLESDSESVKTVEIIKETSLIGDSDDDDDLIKETDLIGCTDDEFTDVSSLSSMTISNGYSLSRLDGSFLSLRQDVLGSKSDLFTTNKDLMSLNDTNKHDSEDEDFERGGEKIIDNETKPKNLLKFHDLESDYFETDCETMDSGIFPHKETEYFQDIGSDFFDDDDEDDDLENGTKQRPKSVKLQKKKTKDGGSEDGKLTPSSSLSPVSPLPPGKTATMSNSLLRSTISELERALGDSNKLLAKRDAKMQVIRSRNIELKKTLSKEVESNTKMKHLLIEKDKIILEKQTKIIALNQEIADINEKLAKLRLTRNNSSESSQTPNASSEKLDDISPLRSRNSNSSLSDGSLVLISPGTPILNGVDNISSSTGERHAVARRSSSGCKKRTSSTTDEPDNNKQIEYSPQNNNLAECNRNNTNNDNLKRNSCREETNNEKKDDEKVGGNELQANLRIKFLRDAFFYYMIGFHPDEQINAILAILEYGDRRQDFVLEAHTMKKSGKKFNVSKVSSRGHSFVQEEFQ